MAERLGNEPGGWVVVGVDGSETSKDALRWAALNAEATRSKLRVVMCWRVPGTPYGYLAPVPPNLDIAGDAKVALDNIVEEVLGQVPRVPVSTVIVEGPAATDLLEEASDADLLVVGNRGHGALVGMLLGSVSEYCVTHAPCPVVVVRPTKTAARGRTKEHYEPVP